jgi:hypothetical protein
MTQKSSIYLKWINLKVDIDINCCKDKILVQD